VRVAYATVGSVTEAEDCVQEAWLRLRRVQDPGGDPRSRGVADHDRQPGLVLRDADGVLSVISFTVDGGRIAAIDVVRNPDRLTGVRGTGLTGPGPM